MVYVKKLLYFSQQDIETNNEVHFIFAKPISLDAFDSYLITLIDQNGEIDSINNYGGCYYFYKLRNKNTGEFYLKIAKIKEINLILKDMIEVDQLHFLDCYILDEPYNLAFFEEGDLIDYTCNMGISDSLTPMSKMKVKFIDPVNFVICPKCFDFFDNCYSNICNTCVEISNCELINPKRPLKKLRKN